MTFEGLLSFCCSWCLGVNSGDFWASVIFRLMWKEPFYVKVLCRRKLEILFRFWFAESEFSLQSMIRSSPGLSCRFLTAWSKASCTKLEIGDSSVIGSETCLGSRMLRSKLLLDMNWLAFLNGGVFLVFIVWARSTIRDELDCLLRALLSVFGSLNANMGSGEL